MTEKQLITLDLVIRTLNSISVSGKENLDMLLGSICVLEKLKSSDTETG